MSVSQTTLKTQIFFSQIHCQYIRVFPLFLEGSMPKKVKKIIHGGIDVGGPSGKLREGTTSLLSFSKRMHWYFGREAIPLSRSATARWKMCNTLSPLSQTLNEIAKSIHTQAITVPMYGKLYAELCANVHSREQVSDPSSFFCATRFYSNPPKIGGRPPASWGNLLNTDTLHSISIHLYSIR